MTWQGRVQNGVVVIENGSGTAPLAEGTLVEIRPVRSVSKDVPGPYPVSQEQREALLGLIGICKTDHPPSDEEVERIIEEARMKKYG